MMEFIKSDFELSMVHASDEEFYNLLQIFEEERNVYFHRELPRAVLEQCLWCIYSGDYELWSDSWAVEPTQKKEYNFSGKAVRTNPYKHTSSKYWVYGLIYSYSPIFREDLFNILPEFKLFKKKEWQVENSIDNTVNDMKKQGILRKNTSNMYEVIE